MASGDIPERDRRSILELASVGFEHPHQGSDGLLRAVHPVPRLSQTPVRPVRHGNTAEQPPTEQVEPTTAPEVTEEPTSEEATTEEATDEDTGADVILTTSISVLNGTGVSGIAGEQAAILEEEGFTSVGAADYGSSAPDVTTLYYRNADLAPTAEAIGELLGIDNVVEAASATQNVEIAIVLRPDFL